MNIDIKNSLSNTLLLFNKINKSGEPNLTDTLVGDIYWLIRHISSQNGESRCDFFNKTYLGGKYPPKEFGYNEQQRIPQIFNKISKNPSLTHIVQALFLVIGKSYTVSKFDRADIDIEKVKQSISDIEAVKCETKKANAAIKKSAVPNDGTKIRKENKAKQDEAEPQTEEAPEPEPEQTLEELLEELNSLVGLTSVKNEINNRINLIKMQNKGNEFGAVSFPFSHHLVFFGNPGTGKTTVARLLSKIYKSLGVLSKGQLVEVDRGKLVAGYIGQTAERTGEIISSAIGGILFIDEAYTLTHGKGDNDFGQEAVDTILKAMEDYRDDFIVIVAGYPDLMKEFIKSNPGLQSRFKNFIGFDDYTPDEMQSIFEYQCKKYGFTLDDGAGKYLKKYFFSLYENRNESYANGRDVRNFFENVVQAHANRLAPVVNDLTEKEYYCITTDDLEKAAEIKRDI